MWPFGDFYSRASREARRGIFGRMVNPWLISTHAPLARRDKTLADVQNSITDFYSRASREARRGIFGRMVNPWLISTHAPLARRDSRQQHKE